MDVKRREVLTSSDDDGEEKPIVSDRPLTPDLFVALFQGQRK